MFGTCMFENNMDGRWVIDDSHIWGQVFDINGTKGSFEFGELVGVYTSTNYKICGRWIDEYRDGIFELEFNDSTFRGWYANGTKITNFTGCRYVT